MLLYGYAGVEYKQKIYFSSAYPVGCLFCFDPDDGSTKFIKQFFVEESQGACHGGAVLYQDTAWFIPWDACRVVCINLNSMQETYFDILNHREGNGHAFADYLVCGDNLFLIPSGEYLDTLVIVDMKKQEMRCFRDVISGSKCIGAYSWENTLYFVSPEGKVISEFDLDKQKIKRIGLEEQFGVQRYTSVLQDKKIVFFIPTEAAQVLAVNLETGKREVMEHPHANYCGGIIVDNGILLYPADDESGFLRLDTGLKSTLRTVCQCGKALGGWMYMEEISSDRMSHLIMGNDGKIYLFDRSGELKESWKYTTQVDECLRTSKIDWEFLKKKFTGEVPLSEAPGMELSYLLSAILEKDLSENKEISNE